MPQVFPGDQTIDRLDINEIKMMFGPKVIGTWVLEQLTRDMKLDFFVCFSSMVSVWGAKRQAHYVAGNHFLDLFAHYRRANRSSGIDGELGTFDRRRDAAARIRS